MKINITFEVSDIDRRALNDRYGREGLADYGVVKAYIIGEIIDAFVRIKGDLDDEVLDQFDAQGKKI